MGSLVWIQHRLQPIKALDEHRTIRWQLVLTGSGGPEPKTGQESSRLDLLEELSQLLEEQSGGSIDETDLVENIVDQRRQFI